VDLVTPSETADFIKGSSYTTHDLDRANQRIDRGVRRVLAQRARIAELVAVGEDTAEAVGMLALLIDELAESARHRELIAAVLRQLADPLDR
jgi:hypothetical protein